MKKLLFAIFVFVLLALNWAALNDILKGESNSSIEYTLLIFNVLVFSVLIFFAKRKNS